jgi:hypothetical protein
MCGADFFDFWPFVLPLGVAGALVLWGIVRTIPVVRD